MRGRPERGAGRPRRGQLPCAANQAPPAEVMKTIGAMHGVGRDSLVSSRPLPPPLDAGPIVTVIGPDWTLTTFAAPAPSTLWQLTTARMEPTGFAFVEARTSPVNFSSREPSLDSSPFPLPITHATPPPLRPLMGAFAPV